MDTSTGNPLTDMHKATKQYKTNRKLQLSQVERFEFLVCGIQIAYNPQKCLSSTQFLVEASLPQYFFLNQRHTSPSNFPSNYTPWNMLIFADFLLSIDQHRLAFFQPGTIYGTTREDTPNSIATENALYIYISTMKHLWNSYSIPFAKNMYDVQAVL